MSFFILLRRTSAGCYVSMEYMKRAGLTSASDLLLHVHMEEVNAGVGKGWGGDLFKSS